MDIPEFQGNQKGISHVELPELFSYQFTPQAPQLYTHAYIHTPIHTHIHTHIQGYSIEIID